MEIREAAAADLPGILSLYSQPDMDNGVHLSPECAEAIFSKMKTYPDYNVYVAVCRGKVVGTFALLIMDNLAHMGAPSGVVEDVVVREELQGRGIGKRKIHWYFPGRILYYVIIYNVLIILHSLICHSEGQARRSFLETDIRSFALLRMTSVTLGMTCWKM